MAELNARIIAKASGTASEEPLAADLEVAELAVNTADGKLFTKHTDGSVVTIFGGGSGGGLGLTGTSLNMDGIYNFSSLPVSIPSNAAVGDLAVIAGSVRASGNPSPIVPIAVPSGWTLARSEAYNSTSDTSSNTLNFILHKELDTSDINAGSVSLSLTTPSTGDDWYIQIASFSDATFGVATIVDTTLTGTLPIAGYDFTGPAAPADGFTFSVATSLYAFSPQGGVQMTPLSGADVAWLNPATDGSGYEEGVVRRISSFLGTGINSFNLGAINDSGVAATLADGFHIMSVSIIPKFSSSGGAVDSVNGETGVVSLGIQDMDDFEPNPSQSSTVYRYATISSVPGSFGANYTQAGDAAYFQDPSFFNPVDSDGNNLFNGLVANSSGAVTDSANTADIWFSTDGLNYTELLNCIAYEDSTYVSNAMRIEVGPYWDPAVDTELFLSFSNPNSTEAPLSEGDTLQWSNVDQKFKPAQTIDKATLQTEVAASADFADFQSRIAAL